MDNVPSIINTDPAMKERLYRLDECLREAYKHANALSGVCVEGETWEMAHQLSECAGFIQMRVNEHCGHVYAETAKDMAMHQRYNDMYAAKLKSYKESMRNK